MGCLVLTLKYKGTSYGMSRAYFEVQGGRLWNVSPTKVGGGRIMNVSLSLTYEVACYACNGMSHSLRYEVVGYEMSHSH